LHCRRCAGKCHLANGSLAVDRFETGPIAEIAISKLVSEEADDTVACVMGSRVPASLTNSFGSHLADRSWIASELCVGGQKRNSFDESLREQKAIKRISVERRKRVDADRVLARDRKLEIAVVEKSAAEDAWLYAEVVAAERGFDRDFPETGSAEEQFVRGIVELFSRPRGKALGLTRSP